jgi:PhzF family phenazine biosynthesis protein
MKIPIFQVDAFTSEVFKGNPAAVCPLENWLPDDLLQKIAMENNLSETAFFVKGEEGFHIRWFTPVTEVTLCGHATLASAAVIFEKLGSSLDRILFHSKSGMLTVEKDKDLYRLNFPSDKISPFLIPEEITKALGSNPLQSFKGREDYLLIYGNEQEITDINPDFKKLGSHSKRGVIVSSPGNDCDFASRFFAPAVGIDEDPVTGSAHTTLIPYWSGVLKKKDLTARQLSSRGGELECTMKGERVEIGGKVIFFMEGIIEI